MGAVWQHRIQDFAADSRTICSEPVATPDLDGDGVGDVFTSWLLLTPPYGWSMDHYHAALSGVDGHPIWEYRARQPWPYSYDRHQVYGRDLDLDGVVDLVTVGCEEILALSGRDGSVLWQQDIHAFDPFLPFGATWSRLAYPALFSTDPTDPGGLDLCISFQGSDSIGMAGPLQMAHLDARTGAAIGLADFPEDLEPWAPDWMDNYGKSVFTVLGDIDRDGLTEIARPVASPGTANPQSTDEHIIVCSQRTLDVSLYPSIGRSYTATLHLPGAPDMDFRLLVSDGFDRAGGLIVDGWPTHLADTPFLRHALAQPGASGHLDANGQGSVTLTIPNHLDLIGRTLWSRAVVLDPARPGKVWTLSTLGESRVQP
ncbi:MAG: hypothetical protein D6702_05915 [Planctomycetota bacterium]|nr:MAG: hypothetical protein D6702_05915 [Planctomycetota bacterium]